MQLSDLVGVSTCSLFFIRVHITARTDMSAYQRIYSHTDNRNNVSAVCYRALQEDGKVNNDRMGKSTDGLTFSALN